MAQAIANPEHIIEFSNALEHYLQTIEEETSRLDSAFQELGETWQDQQRTAFEEKYNQLHSALAAFKENATQQIPHLRIMADDLNTYLRR
jgi:uncharacterized protein YukE